MRTVILILGIIVCLSFGYENHNRSEYYNTISTLIQKIKHLSNYQYTITNGIWSAKSKNGFYNFEGKTIIKNENDDYTLLIKGIIYSEDYFRKSISLNIPYYIYRENNKIDTSFLTINTASESIEDSLPFKMKDVNMVYMEKEIGIPYSKEIVFNRLSINETYLVLYKNRKIKKFYLDPIDRKYYQDTTNESTY